MIRIQTFKYFGRSYSDSSLDRWFCPVDGKVYDTDEMKETFGFSDETEIEAVFSFTEDGKLLYENGNVVLEYDLLGGSQG